jgi:hypothetical protein
MMALADAPRLRQGGGASWAKRATIAAIVVVYAASPAVAQEKRCRILCAPELKVEPTFTVEDLFQRPTIETLEDGRVVESSRVGRETVFEIIFALDVPTEIPRIGLTLEAIFVPFGDTAVNPFTGVPASELGRSAIRDNGVEIESELNLILFETEQTGGWLSSHFDIVDKFSPAATPGAKSVFTHKLNFEWDTAVHVFKRLPESNWLRNVELEVSLDYVATGLPKAGDVLGDERFVQKASPWSISFVIVLPLAPLVP